MAGATLLVAMCSSPSSSRASTSFGSRSIAPASALARLVERARRPRQHRQLHAPAQRLRRRAHQLARRLQRRRQVEPGHLRFGQLQVRALHRLGVVVVERQHRRLAQRRDHLRAVGVVAVRVGEVRPGQVPLDRRRDLQRSRDLLGGVVEAADADEQLGQVGAHLGGVGIERQRALQLVGGFLPAFVLLEQHRARDVFVRLGADRARDHDAPLDDLRHRLRRRRAATRKHDRRRGSAPTTRSRERSRASPGGARRGRVWEPSQGSHPHNGMFPCFLGGLVSRLLPIAASARISLARVSRGRITSSM